MFLKVTEKAKISIKISDKFGNEAKVDGKPVWALSAELGTLEVAEDGLSAVFSPGPAVGALMVQVKADADLDATGVKEILGELALDLLAGEAEKVELAAEVVA